MRNTFCLSSVSTCNQISSSPLNRSSSKNLWSFGKDSRFKSPRVYCDKMYEMHSSLKGKGPSIGYGIKYDFTKDLTISPGSSKYEIKNVFENNRKSQRGYTFSLSREVHFAFTQKIPTKGYIPIQPLKVPPPTKYNNIKNDQGLRYTMRMKTKNLDPTMSINSQNDNPGSGRYQNPEQLSPRGKYFVSKHKGTGSSVFNPKSSLRFLKSSTFVPGPGTYQQINGLSNEGHYPLSKSNSFGKRIFGRDSRISLFENQAKKNKVPGPGSYRAPSEFGHYDGNLQSLNLIMGKTGFSKKSSQEKLSLSLRSSVRKN